MRLKAYGNNVEKLFTVTPDANPEAINIEVCGAKALAVNKEGELVAETELGPVKFTKPIAYQEIDGERVYVEVAYKIQDVSDGGANALNNEMAEGKAAGENSKLCYGFTVAAYNPAKDLIIDPLQASTFLGGSDGDYAYSIAIDSSDRVFVVGRTYSANFPTTSGVYDTSFNGGSIDVFISRLSNSLGTLQASTFLGGSGIDEGYSLYFYGDAGDAASNAYITGYTSSTDFPTTSGAYDTSHNGGSYDVFVSKLDGRLTTLVASTYLGGDDTDGGNSIDFQIVNATPGSVSYIYVTGVTESSNFPATSGAYDTSFNGGTYGDVFVSKFNSGLTSLSASTFVGGSNSESGLSLVHDSSGNVYVTGQTDSSDFPTTSGAYDTTKGTVEDVFVSKLNNGLTSLSASTFLGGGSSDFGVDIALDSNEDVYVTGNTSSSNFPTTGGAYDTSYGGGNSDAFISKLNNVLTGLNASTFLGHESADEGASLAFNIDGSGSTLVYVTGRTNSPSFPTTSGAYDTSHNGLYDAFISRLNSGLSTLQASTFLGGSEREWSQSIAINSNGRVFVTGYTNSSDFPTVSGSYDTSYNGDPRDAFVSKLDSDLSN